MTDDLDYSSINLDFKNIHDAPALIKIIHQLKAIIQNKIKHINDLSLMHDKQQKERQIIIKKMTQNNKKNEKKIEQYKEIIYSISEQYTKFMKDSDEDKEKQKKSIENTHQLEIQDINRKIEDAEAEYKKLKEFQQLQADYISRIQNFNKNIVAKQYQHNDGMNLEEAIQMKQNKDLYTNLNNEISNIMKTAPAHAIIKISTQLQTNEEKNIQLKQKLSQLQSELQKLKKQRNEIVNKRKELQINVTLNQEELEQYKAVGSLQKAKIKAYKDKFEKMKVLISEEVAKKQKNLVEHKKERESNLKILKLKLFNLQKQKEELKLKTDKITILGQTILQQRTQIEQFFIMALENCRMQIQAFEKGKPFKDEERSQKVYGDKVDIDQLLPKDKQRILTNLYTKLAFGTK